MEEHTQTSHIICNACDETFLTELDLEWHQETTHTPLEKAVEVSDVCVSCPSCDFTSSNQTVHS